MKQKSKLLKTLGIMLLFVLFATQANAQNITVTGTVTIWARSSAPLYKWKEPATDVSRTLTVIIAYPMFLPTQLWYFRISVIRHKKWQ